MISKHSPDLTQKSFAHNGSSRSREPQAFYGTAAKCRLAEDHALREILVRLRRVGLTILSDAGH